MKVSILGRLVACYLRQRSTEGLDCAALRRLPSTYIPTSLLASIAGFAAPAIGSDSHRAAVSYGVRVLYTMTHLYAAWHPDKTGFPGVYGSQPKGAGRDRLYEERKSSIALKRWRSTAGECHLFIQERNDDFPTNKEASAPVDGGDTGKSYCSRYQNPG